MTDLDTSGLDGFGEPRATERFGGREAVGSALWLEHTDGIDFVDENGDVHTLTQDDLVNDELREAAESYPRTNLGRIYSQDIDLVTRESWLRRTLLPTLPIRISGDLSEAPLRLTAELAVFRVPRELARYAGIISEVLDQSAQEAQENGSLGLSLRLVPTVGRVESVGIYPGYTDERYGITATEFGSEVVKIAIGYQKYIELFRDPQVNPLPELTAPHQF